MLVQEPGWELVQHTVSLGMRTMRSYVHSTGSQGVSSDRWCSLTVLGSDGDIPEHRDERPLPALQHHYQHHLVSHPRMGAGQPCLASRAAIGAGGRLP